LERTHTWGGAKDAPELPTELPFEGVVSDAYDAFREKGTLTVSNQKTFAKEHPSLEPVFMVKGVKTLVICPIERENGYIGLFGLENPPAGKIGWLASSARLIAFFIAVVLQTRDSQAELLRNSYVDHLTGVGNRRSLDEIRDKLSKGDVRYGMMMCDINGLKNVNDEHGHKAGDDMICDVASCLKDIFGDRRVFRMGGDEFLVVREGGNREQFENAVAEAWKKIESMGRSVSVGTAFSDEEADFEKMQRLADTRMYENKRVFYSRDGHDRRRGR
ncbi:MAG: GGDEF domain-containing protein, partial [Eubacterium sp.]|nr:GGDEF domain-containing protein [Eubacterium sp.]